MQKRLFIFDYDGTICDTSRAISTSLTATFAEYSGAVPQEEDIARLIGTGKTLQETIHELRPTDAGPLDDGELKRWVDSYRKRYADHGDLLVSLFDRAEETLVHLRSAGDLVLLSNKGIDAVEGSLNRFGIRDHFSLVLAEEPGQPRKPDPEVFFKRISPLFPAMEPADCVVIGDTAADLEFARSIGAAACFAEYGFGDRASCEQIGYTHALTRLGDLVGLFDRR
ncbi:MAG: HAD family hydrolase [Burkholderiaceae bacterium]